jgi:uncharacterized membrane protein
MVLGFSQFMPRRTGKGRKFLLEILGLKRIIKLGSYRQEIYEKHNYFNEILPFAIAFGLTKQWAKTVKELSVPQPKWYQSYHPFTPVDFGRSMQVLASQSHSLTTNPSKSASSGSSGFSSGGSSGGGFGGGGGGSW